MKSQIDILKHQIEKVFKHNHDIDEFQVIKRQIFLLVTVAFVAVNPLYGIFYHLQGAGFAGWVSIISAALAGILLIFAVKTNRSLVNTNILLSILYLSFLLQMSQYGGLRSPVLSWSIALPALAVFFMSLRWGLLWCLLLTVKIAFFLSTDWGASASGHSIAETAILLDTSTRWFFVVLMIFMLTAFYERQARLTFTIIRDNNKHLMQSEQRFKDLVDNLADWVWEIDANWCYTYCSSKIEQVLGYRPGEMIGRRFDEFLERRSCRDTVEEFQSYFQQQKKFKTIENCHTRKDGEIIHFEASGAPIYNEENVFIGYRGVQRNITDRKRIEEQLLESEKKFRSIFNNMLDIYLRTDPSGKILLITPSVKEFSGMQPEELIGTSFKSYFRNGGQYQKLLRELKKNQVVKNFEISLKDANDKTRALSCNFRLLQDSDGQSSGIEGIMHDVTERKNSELELQQSFEEILHWKKYFEIINDVTEKINRNRQIQEVGKAIGNGLEQIFSYDAYQIYTIDDEGRHLVPVLTDDNYEDNEMISNVKTDADKGIIGKIFQSSEALLIDDVRTHPEVYYLPGEERIAESLIGAPLVADSKTIGVIVTLKRGVKQFREEELQILSIFGRQVAVALTNARLNESERKSRELAEAANEAKSHFLANMSHEIRTPMNAIIGMTELVMDTPLTEDQYDYLKTVHESAYALLNIINDILDFSKIEAGKLELSEEVFDLKTTLETTVESLAFRAEEKGLELALSFDPNLPLNVVGDPGRLRQILINLIGNAIKFTIKGEVVVQVKGGKESDEDVELLFSVRDTGIGISAEKLSIIFDKFTQADASSTRRFGGTGLGLAISKQLCELMGGQLQVNSEIDEGSTFIFNIYLKKAKKSRAPKFVIPENLEGLRILIVDDNETNRFILEKVLESWGCQALSANDGKSGLEQLRRGIQEKEPIPLVLLDMQMPEMDGEEVAETLFSDAQFNDTRVIILTSMGKRGDAARLQKMGCHGYLVKPVKQTQLFNMIISVMRQEYTRPPKTEKEIITRHSLEEEKRQNIKILLAEDNLINQRVAVKILEKMNYQVEVVANGVEAIQALQKDQYDLVLMDVQMPEMDGLTATQKIRADQSIKSNLPIIAMTAHAMKGDREKCIESGMNDYISKPIQTEELYKIIEKYHN